MGSENGKEVLCFALNVFSTVLLLVVVPGFPSMVPGGPRKCFWWPPVVLDHH